MFSSGERASECLFFPFLFCTASEAAASPLGFWASPAQTRVTFCTHKKSPKMRWGDPRPPFFAQSVCIETDTGQPLKHLWPTDLLVIGAVDYGLRLSPLGLRGVSSFVGGRPPVSHSRRQVGIENQLRLSLRARRPLSTAPPVADTNEGRPSGEAGRATRHRSDAKKRCFSGREVSNLIMTDWTKAGVQPEGGWRFFRPLLGVQKWTRRRQNSAEGRFWLLRKSPGSGTKVGPAAFPPARRRANQSCIG